MAAPHPLFSPQYLRRSAPGRAFRKEPLLAYLRKGNFRLPFHPLFDVDLYLAQAPEALEHPSGPLGHYLEIGMAGGLRPNDWYEPSEGGLGRWVCEAPPAPTLGTHQTRRRRRGISIVIHGNSDTLAIDKIVGSIHEEAAALGAEVLVLGRSRDFMARGVFASIPLRYPDLVFRAYTADVPADQALDRLVREAHGRRVVLLREESRPLEGWLNELLQPLGTRGVVAAQSLLLDDRGLIRDSGRVLDGKRSVPVLTGFPPEDLLGTTLTGRVSVSTAALAARRRWLREALAQPRPTPRGVGVVVPTSMVEVPKGVGDRLDLDPLGVPSLAEALTASGFETRPHGGVAWIGRPDAPEGSLRWAIKISAPFSDSTKSWGDEHFAQSLAASLRGLGQHVAIDHRLAHSRESGVHDEVALVLRGGVKCDPVPGATNILWIISRPAWVKKEEMDGFDVICAASPTWARRRSRKTGTRIVPLMQATDTARFHPDVPRLDPGFGWLFVGNAYVQEREIVFETLEAGLPLSVIGSRWREKIPPQYVAGNYFPNERLGSAYASATVVLNDHKEDMRTAGFLCNRLFDAAAVGARVLTDDIDGVHEVFGRNVRTLSEVGDLSALAHADLDEIFGSESDRRSWALSICQEHSFDKRAEQLLALAQEARVQSR
jgi:hypothetical protein